MKALSTQEGLTLLEILVAMAILSVMLAVTYSSFFSASRTSDLLESNEDTYQTARSLFELFSRELRALNLYSYKNPATGAQETFGLKGVNTEDDGHPVDAIYFLTSSHRRREGIPGEGTMSEVTYFFDIDLIDGKKRLVRIEDPTIDFDFLSGGKTIVLTDRVDEMDITYKKGDSDEWQDEWDMEAQRELPGQIRIVLSFLNDQEEATSFRTIIQPSLQR
jgi:general secretion pathway protein J